jgi:GTPase
MFVDVITLILSAGKGGDGVVAWRREKYLPKGGPTGGNGGRGGSVIIRTSPHHFSLEHLRNLTHLKARNGQGGGSANCTGKSGEDLIIEVPTGTLVKDAHTKEVLFDLTEKDRDIVICEGGRGGRGNASFRSSTNRAPDFCTKGTLGDEKNIELELKLIADIGFVGMPNAGKSTLFTALTDVYAKSAPYPFTTMHPSLGILFDAHTPIFLADIPGIIDGASQNKGLGLAFLRHIQRTEVLVYVIDISASERSDPKEDYLTLQRELAQYDPSLLDKPSIIALNKIDEDVDQIMEQDFKDHVQTSHDIVAISALDKTGLQALKEKLISLSRLAKEHPCTADDRQNSTYPGV